MNTPLAPPRTRRLWRWVRRGAVVLTGSAIALVVWLAIDWQLTYRAGTKKVESIVARLNADDPGWQFIDILSAHNAQVPPLDSNSALRAIKIVREFPRSDAQNLKRKVDERRLPNERPAAGAWAKLDEQFADHEPGIVELRKWNADTPKARWFIEYLGGSPLEIRLPHLDHIRTATFALHWDAIRFAHAGQPDQSLASAEAALHLVRACEFEPFLISHMVRLSVSQATLDSVVQTLAWCPNASDIALARLQALLLLDSTHTSLQPAVRCERAALHLLFGLVVRDKITLDGKRPNRWDLSDRWYRRHLPNNLVFIHEQVDEFDAMFKLSTAQRARAVREWTMPPNSHEIILGQLMFPAFDKCLTVDIRYQVRALCAVAALGCERYRLSRGAWPDSLADLGEYGVPVPLLDPFDNQPLRYKFVEDGVAIYSVGADGVDDDGDILGGQGARRDIGVRLWNVLDRGVPIDVK